MTTTSSIEDSPRDERAAQDLEAMRWPNPQAPSPTAWRDEVIQRLEVLKLRGSGSAVIDDIMYQSIDHCIALVRETPIGGARDE